MTYFRLLIFVFCFICNWQMAGEISGSAKNQKYLGDSIKVLDTSFGKLIGMSLEKGEYYVYDSVSSELEGQAIIKIHRVEDGVLKETVRLKKGDCASPSELCAPTFIQFIDNKFFICDVDKKVAVYNHKYEWLYSSRYYQPRHFAAFLGSDPSYSFVLGEYDVKDEKIELTIQLNYFDNHYLITNKKTIENFLVDYPRKRFTKNGILYVDFVYFIPTMHGFEQCGNLVYCLNSNNYYTIYNLTDDLKKNIIVPRLRERIFSRNEAQLAGYFKTDGFEENRKKNGLVFTYVPYQKRVFHLGMLKVGRELIGFVSDLNCKSMVMQLDIFHYKTGKYIKSVNLPAGKNFTRAISMFGPGYRHTFFDYDKGVYIWQDVDDEFETITCLGVLKKDKK